jgi:flavin reductase (DIM6/NTAB) family NADH-FMN oxidoreductase RutF
MNESSKPDPAAAAVARIPSCLAILTASHEGEATGMLASWVQQASMSPLMVSVCVKRGRPIEAIVDASGRFLLNILGEDSVTLMKHFAAGFARGEDAFANLQAHQEDAGVRIAGVIAYIGCRVVKKTPAGDHFLYVGEVTDGSCDDAARPYVHLRKTARSY